MPLEEKIDLESTEIRPTRDRIFVRLIDKDQQEKNGLIVVNRQYDDRKKYVTALVISVGPEVFDLIPGDVVLLNGFSGTRVGEDEGGSVLRMAEMSEILALIEPASGRGFGGEGGSDVQHA